MKLKEHLERKQLRNVEENDTSVYLFRITAFSGPEGTPEDDLESVFSEYYSCSFKAALKRACELATEERYQHVDIEKVFESNSHYFKKIVNKYLINHFEDDYVNLVETKILPHGLVIVKEFNEKYIDSNGARKTEKTLFKALNYIIDPELCDEFVLKSMDIFSKCNDFRIEPPDDTAQTTEITFNDDSASLTANGYINDGENYISGEFDKLMENAKPLSK